VESGQAVAPDVAVEPGSAVSPGDVVAPGDAVSPGDTLAGETVAEDTVTGDRVAGDTVAVSLSAAIEGALSRSEEVGVARAQVSAARARLATARRSLLPQVSGTFAFTKTFASVFDTGDGFTLPDSLQFRPDPTRPLEERVAYLEEAAPLAATQALGGLFSDLPFGRENMYIGSLSGSQVLFAGGRIMGGIQIADAALSAAESQLEAERSSVRLQVRSAYYGAVVAREFRAIAAAAVEQAAEFLAEERLRLEAGRASELDVLRAEVSLENLRPQLIEAENASELASLNLKRLVNLPLDAALELTTDLDVPPAAALETPELAPEFLAQQEAALSAAERAVAISRQQVGVARSSFLPTVALQMNYAQQSYPSEVFGFDADWRTDWTATVAVSWPLFQGAQRFAQLAEARAGTDRARLQLDQLREAVALQRRQALGEKRRAGAQIAARRRTVEQAERVYDLVVLQYEEGLATQLEVSQARLGLLQARTNLARALSDFYTAEAGLAMSLGGAAGGMGAGSGGAGSGVGMGGAGGMTGTGGTAGAASMGGMTGAGGMTGTGGLTGGGMTPPGGN
jgi:outer membrane protein TolC